VTTNATGPDPEFPDRTVAHVTRLDPGGRPLGPPERTVLYGFRLEPEIPAPGAADVPVVLTGAPPEVRPVRMLSDAGPERVTTCGGERTVWRQVGWLSGRTGEFYALGELLPTGEPSWHPLYAVAHSDRLD